jgi:steroid delta-isomerase-like uncharacterized protein
MFKVANERLIKRYFEDVWNNGDLDALDEIIALDYVNHSQGDPNPLPGPIGLKPIVAGIRRAFPDLNYVIENMVISESQVAIHTTMYGTNTGDFFGLAPTNNQIVEHWRLTDDLTMLRQLGQIHE